MMDDGIDGIFGKKEYDLYSLNSKFNKFETDTTKRMVEISEELSHVPTVDEIFGDQCTYQSIQNPMTSPNNNVKWRYRKCPENYYVCGFGAGYQDKWEARFFQLGCCK